MHVDPTIVLPGAVDGAGLPRNGRLIGDSFAKLGLGMIADGTPIFGLTGWAGTFAALDAAAIGCIVLMAMVAVLEERKIRRENRAQKLKVA